MLASHASNAKKFPRFFLIAQNKPRINRCLKRICHGYYQKVIYLMNYWTTHLSHGKLSTKIVHYINWMIGDDSVIQIPNHLCHSILWVTNFPHTQFSQRIKIAAVEYREDVHDVNIKLFILHTILRSLFEKWLYCFVTFSISQYWEHRNRDFHAKSAYRLHQLQLFRQTTFQDMKKKRIGFLCGKRQSHTCWNRENFGKIQFTETNQPIVR